MGALLYAGYAGLHAGVYGYPYAHAAVVPAASVVTGNSVPVAVGGYKAVAGSNGDLAGPVHEVPGLVPALAVQKQESSGDVSLSTGTGALVHTPVVTYYGKREAEADPALVYGGLPYAGVYGYPYAAHVPLTYAVKPLGATMAETTCSRDKETWEWVEEINGEETKETILVVEIKVGSDKATLGHRSGAAIRGGTTEVWVGE